MPYANNQGVKLYYEVEGQGQPLFLSHAGFSDMSVWKDYGYVEKLKDRCRVILMDARGFYHSDKPYDAADYDYRLVASDVIAVLDELQIEKAHFWGYSMGGSTGFALAKLYPERFHSFIIGGSSPYNDYDPNRPDELFELLQRAADAGDEGTNVIVEGIRAVYGGSLMPQIEARLRRFDARAQLAWMEAFQNRPSLGDVLPTMTMPCLVYTGEFDDAAETEAYVQQMPNASLFIVPGRTHGYTSLAVDELVPRVLEFLATVK